MQYKELKEEKGVLVGEIGPTGANGEGSTSVDLADVNLIHQQPSIATDKVRVRMRVRVSVGLGLGPLLRQKHTYAKHDDSNRTHTKRNEQVSE